MFHKSQNLRDPRSLRTINHNMMLIGLSKCAWKHEIYRSHCYRMGKTQKPLSFSRKGSEIKTKWLYDILHMLSSSGPEIRRRLEKCLACLACQGTVRSQQRFLKEHRPSCSARLALSSTNSPAIWLRLKCEKSHDFSTFFDAPCLAVGVVRKVQTRRCKGLANVEMPRGVKMIPRGITWVAMTNIRFEYG